MPAPQDGNPTCSEARNRPAHAGRRRLKLAVLLSALTLAGMVLLQRGCSGGDPLKNVPRTQPAAATGDANTPATGHADPASAIDPLAGQWEGKWESDGAAGDGPLRAGITRIDDGTYLATFVARWGGGMFTNVSRDVPLRITGQKDGRVMFTGEKDLGVLNGGTYTYVGFVEDQQFQATYDSSFDQGTFTMTRPQDPNSPQAGR